MEVIFKGRYFSKNNRQLMVDFAQWTGNKLLGKRLNRHMSVVIHAVGPRLLEVDRFYGLTCICEDDDWDRPRNFVIKITSKYGILRSLIIIAHEMVHVKQQAKRELSYCSRSGSPRWHGQTVDDDTVDYWDLPWEIEAHGREKGLVYQWARANGHLDKKWVKEIF